jgi:hypothetical protein
MKRDVVALKAKVYPAFQAGLTFLRGFNKSRVQGFECNTFYPKKFEGKILDKYISS